MNNESAIVPEYLPANAVESASRAEIDISIATAIKYPHHSPDKLSKVKQDMMTFATMDQATAEACFYTLPRGGKNIQGPSVRMAEVAVACYGNVRMGTRILSVVIDGDTPHVVVQAVGHDLEKNIYVSIEKRRRIVKKKSKDTIDEDDINLATNACSAICFRDVTFKIVPQALIRPVFEACRKVAIGDQKTLADRRAKCIATFAAMGVRQEKVLAKLEKRAVEDIGLDDLETLIGLHNAIKEGEVNIDEAFDTRPGPESHTPEPTPQQKMQQQAAQTSTPTAATPPPEAQKPIAPANGTTAATTTKSAAQQAQEGDQKRRGRPPGSKNRVEKLTPQEAAEIRKGGQAVAETAIAYPEGTGPEDFDADGNRKEAAPVEAAKTDDADLAGMGLAPEPEQPAQAEPTPTAEQTPPPQPAEPMEFAARAGEQPMDTQKRAMGYLGELCAASEVKFEQLLGFCRANKIANEKQKLTDLATDKLFLLGKNWAKLVDKIKAIAA